ncbi:sigma-70 family RNA polymerase sigma factor [uncultured Tateyamaria sp.]|uniref:sigma-70 family RNA polymerase sigma factor n=1 Tax=Tateyamaria sp. 1078 TaxID=3417464 RepID=UPI002636FAB1|nr:sigma-70 family RNA polymerase sigma factor [uncultured Tateyamaria sp.]
MTQTGPNGLADTQIAAIRPRLHRYSARMLGSALDAEDVVQDSLASALVNWPAGGVRNVESWLFRIVHNRTIDHMRRTERVRMEPLPEQPIADDTPPPLEARELATFALTVFLQLTPLQRSALILKDVMGHSLAEVSEMLDVSVGGVKSALSRGRDNLRRIAPDRDTADTAALPVADADRLHDYVDRFIGRDFDGIRAQLLADVSLDLVGRVRQQGAGPVGRYFSNYSDIALMSARPVTVEGHPAMHITDGDGDYVVILGWRGGRIARIRDFRYARYVMDSARMVPLA